MDRKSAFLVCSISLFALGNVALGAILQCDAGTGALQSGWTQVVAGLNTNVAGSGIDVTLATGDQFAIAHRNMGGSGPLAAVEEDLYFADGETASPGSDFILTLGNLPGGRYLVKSYHNRSNESATTIPGVTVTGAADVVTPATIVQDHPIMDNPAEILFTANGTDDVVIRYQGPDGGCPGCQAFFNGFELETAGATVQFESASSGALESVSPAALIVNLSETLSETVTVNYAVSDGTADNVVDYTVLGTGTLTFDPFDTAETISITIVNDGEDEENETIIIELSNPSGVELGGIIEHTYTIIDPRPDVRFSAQASSGSEDVTPATIAVTLSHTWPETVTVDYEVTDGAATGGGEDYTLADGTLIFDPCETAKSISITIVDDPCEEGPETIELILSEPNNAKLGNPANHTFTINDDELAPSFTNSLGMKFILIMPDTFQMGSEDGEWDEQPVHNVTISQPFYVQEVETTGDEYGVFDSNYSGTDAVTGMSWHDANSFADWLSQQEGMSYRLPTEAEWEFVCRAGTTTHYSSGGAPPPAGTANAWGVKNMHNAPREWVRDWYGEYSRQNQTDPVGSEQGLARVIRGGGLDEDTSYYMRSANRAGIGPGFGGGDHYVGIRLVVGELPATAPEPYEAPFARQAIKENAAQVTQDPNPGTPYFNQRPLLPIPPDNASRDVIDAAGLHPSFRGHNHSPALEVCPNGDVLMITYTSYSEYEPGVSLMATRLRFGALDWDMPTPMFDFPGVNDHAPMLWTDNGTLHFFWGCPRLDGGGPYPFQWMSSTDNGATWDEVKFPEFIGSIGGHSRQPINTALRDGNTIYVSSDADGGESVLWKSDNNGLTWYDPGGRTGGRHTTFVFLNNGDILGMGGKNTDINGYMPKSISSDGAQSWTVSSTPFSWLGSNQRPCIVRLASGRLFFCSDYQHSFDCDQPAGFTDYGSLVALSDDEGQTWTVKKLTTALEHECTCWPCSSATLGYSAARQAPNGVIHVISTMNHPCQHFEMNEAWILAPAAPAVPPADPGTSGSVSQYQEDYPGGATKVTFGAKTCTDGRYLLHGVEKWYYEGGEKQYEVTYYNGQKVGTETYWDPDGLKEWGWDHNEPDDSSLWTQYWPNGLKGVESSWRYGGMLANGNAYHWSLCGQPEQAHTFTDGSYDGTTVLPEPQTTITADLTGDCSVDANDLKVLSDDWLKTGYYVPTVEPNDAELILHYDFNETSGTTLADSSGNSHTGTFFTDVYQTPAEISGRMDPGRKGNSFHFSARIVTAGISIPYNFFSLHDLTQEITISCWIKNSHPEEEPDSGAFMWEFREWDGFSTVGGPRVLAVETTGRNANFTFHDDTESASYALDWSDHTEWTHYAFVRDAANLKIYVDGYLQSQANSSGNTMADPVLLYVGVSADRAPGNTSGLHDGFTGNMDDFKIYEYALADDEILYMANDGDAYVPLDSLANLFDDDIINAKDFAIMASQWLDSLQ